MSETAKIYIAGMGMVTPIGANAEMTAAAVKAGISGYQATDYFTRDTQQPITMTRIPREHLDAMTFEFEDSRYSSAQHGRILKMSILAMREALSGHTFDKPVPLLLAMPEDLPSMTYIDTETYLRNLLIQKDCPLHADSIGYIRTGRAAGIQGLALAQRYLFEKDADYVLLGGSDSHWAYPRLGDLDEAQRLLTPLSQDGFAPGEGAGFLLLTRHVDRALTHDNHVICLSPPGSSQELGHIFSEEPYKGDGLDQAFKQALLDHTGADISTIYSSMNGENYWAKEYGVAYMRNKQHFHDPVNIEHPADCYGDLGAATGPVLIGLAADSLFKQPGAAAHMVYSSSDGAARAAVRVEKINTTSRV